MDGLKWTAGSILTLTLGLISIKTLPENGGDIIQRARTILLQTDGIVYKSVWAVMVTILTVCLQRIVKDYMNGEYASLKKNLTKAALAAGVLLVVHIGGNIDDDQTESVTRRCGEHSTELPNSVKTQNILTDAGIIQLHTRLDWGASLPHDSQDMLTLPADYVIVSHTADTARIETTEECLAAVKNLQQVGFSRRFSDISYNYLVCNDGHIYEGCGHQYKGATAKGWNNGIGFAFIGKFVDSLPSQQALDTTRAFLQCLVDDGVLTSDFSLHALRDVAPARFPEAPGTSLYSLLRQWRAERGGSWSWRKPKAL